MARDWSNTPRFISTILTNPVYSLLVKWDYQLCTQVMPLFMYTVYPGVRGLMF